jgi:hypothetical protein
LPDDSGDAGAHRLLGCHLTGIDLEPLADLDATGAGNLGIRPDASLAAERAEIYPMVLDEHARDVRVGVEQQVRPEPPDFPFRAWSDRPQMGERAGRDQVHGGGVVMRAGGAEAAQGRRVGDLEPDAPLQQT